MKKITIVILTILSCLPAAFADSSGGTATQPYTQGSNDFITTVSFTDAVTPIVGSGSETLTGTFTWDVTVEVVPSITVFENGDMLTTVSILPNTQGGFDWNLTGPFGDYTLGIFIEGFNFGPGLGEDPFENVRSFNYNSTLSEVVPAPEPSFLLMLPAGLVGLLGIALLKR